MGGLRAHPVPETVTCRACAEPFTWDGRSSRRPHYCDDAVCRRRRANDRAYRYFLRTRAKGRGPNDCPGSLPRPLAPPLEVRPVALRQREPTWKVEQLLARAKAARLAEERRTGQRRFTLEDGWQQRGPGYYHNPGADLQGDGWS